MLSSNNQLNIEQFFSYAYVVPAYQRDYAWENAEVDDLLEDFASLDRGDLPELFLGQIVICENDGVRAIVDGQQRITTLWLFFLAIRNLGKLLNKASASDEYVASELEGTLGIARKDRHKDKLTLGDKDKTFFCDLSYKQPEEIPSSLPKNARKARKNLVSNYWRIYSQLAEWVESYDTYSERVVRLTEIQDAVLDKVMVFTITTTEEAEAYIIFETLNARGRDLATADLLKNYLFKVAGQNLDSVKTSWNEMSDLLGNSDPTKYIRALWNSKHETICREKLLYKALKKECSTPLECHNLMNGLKKLASVYCFLADPSNAPTPSVHPECFDDKNKKRYRSLFRLRVKTFFPILLSALGSESFNLGGASGFERLLKALEIVVVRNLVIGEENPNSLEINFAAIAYKIYSQVITDVSSAEIAIRELAIKDDAFNAKLTDYCPSKATEYKARFLLRGIENYGNSEQLLEDNKDIHLEHIMPISNAKWNVDQAIHEANLWRLGNLTLLGAEYNEEAQNEIFDTKKTIYDKSTITLTKSLCEYSAWNVDSIDDRETSLFEKIKTIWAINQSEE